MSDCCSILVGWQPFKWICCTQIWIVRAIRTIREHAVTCGDIKIDVLGIKKKKIITKVEQKQRMFSYLEYEELLQSTIGALSRKLKPCALDTRLATPLRGPMWCHRHIVVGNLPNHQQQKTAGRFCIFSQLNFKQLKYSGWS